MRLHNDFEWDSAKAHANLRKHGVSFDHAATALADDTGDFTHFEQHDKTHSHHEDRYVTIASYPFDRSMILVVIWTERQDAGVAVTRIISARHAARKERKQYEEYIRGKLGP